MLPWSDPKWLPFTVHLSIFREMNKQRGRVMIPRGDKCMFVGLHSPVVWMEQSADGMIELVLRCGSTKMGMKMGDREALQHHNMNTVKRFFFIVQAIRCILLYDVEHNTTGWIGMPPVIAAQQHVRSRLCPDLSELFGRGIFCLWQQGQ